MALSITSNLALWFLVLYIKTKSENQKQRLDAAVMALTLKDSIQSENNSTNFNEVLVLIPAFNEATNLEQLLPRIPTHIEGSAVTTVVIDDGSSDETVQTAEKHNAFVLKGLVNRGQGGASRLGYSLFKHANAKYGVTLDADNQHDPRDIQTLLVPLLKGNADLVIGSRVLGQADKASLVRSLGVFLFSWSVSLFTGRRITDCSSGFKAFNRKWIDSVELKEDQFQSTEVIIDSIKKGLRVLEVPITIHSRPFGESKKGTNFRYGFNFAKVMTKTWLRK